MPRLIPLLFLLIVGCASIPPEDGGPKPDRYHAPALPTACPNGDTRAGPYCYTVAGLNKLCAGGEKYFQRFGGVCDGVAIDP